MTEETTVPTSAERPLVWTIYGNLPVDELELNVFWEVAPGQLTCVEQYRRGHEIVRESRHVWQPQKPKPDAADPQPQADTTAADPQ